jgi:hypothetical protein
VSWGTIWAVWAVAAIGSFAVFETAALVTKRNGEGTLSENLRMWLGVRPVKPWRLAASVGLLGFLVWFGWHIVFQTS